jgi:hypothetical protein
VSEWWFKVCTFCGKHTHLLWNTEVRRTKVCIIIKPIFVWRAMLKLYTNLLTLCYNVFLHHVIVIQLVKKFPVSMES